MAIAAPSAAPSSILLPEGTRLVHIGPPKTGTTAVQGAFHARRREVLAQGVRYAGRSRHSGTAVLAVTGRPSFQRDSGPPPMRSWDELAAEVRNAAEPRVLLSSEFFADAEADRIPRIVEDLGREHVHVVVTLRPLARILASQWQQYVQSFMRLSYGGWLDGVLNQPRGAVTPTFWRRHRQDELIERWAEVVGAGNVTAVVIDEHDHDHVLRVFEALLGLRSGTLVADADVTNRSMTLPEIEAVRAFNIAYWDAGLRNALFHRVMHFGAAAYMKQRPPAADEPRIETPQWALARSGEIAHEMVGRIANSGVRVVGDLEALTIVPEDGGAGDHQRGVCIPPDIAASMAMGMVVAAGAARGRAGVNALAAGAGSMTPSAAPSSGNNGEPAGLGRFSTYHLLGTIGMRSVSRVFRWMDRLRTRARGRVPADGPALGDGGPGLAAFRRWLDAAGFGPADRDRFAAAAAHGLRWVPADGSLAPGPKLPEGCVPPRVAAGMTLGLLVERGLAIEAPGGKLRGARLPWAEPPELAVVTSPRLAWVGVRRILGNLRSG